MGSCLWGLVGVKSLGSWQKTKKTLPSIPTSEKKIYTKTMYIFFSEWESFGCFSFFLFSFFCGFFSFFFVSFSFSFSAGVLSLGSCWGRSLGSCWGRAGVVLGSCWGRAWASSWASSWAWVLLLSWAFFAPWVFSRGACGLRFVWFF